MAWAALWEAFWLGVGNSTSQRRMRARKRFAELDTTWEGPR